MLTTFNQRNPDYKDLTLGTSGVDFQKNGCTTCAICVGMQKLGSNLLPSDLAKIFKYTDSDYPNMPKGLLLWYSTDFRNVKFGVRGGRPSQGELSDFSNKDDKFMILELYGGSHWVMLYKTKSSWVPWVLVADSYPKNPNRKNGIIRKVLKSSITGFATFYKV